MRLDVKWLLIRHYIESKNPREDQYSVNHGFGVGDHLFNEHLIAVITSPHITHAGDIRSLSLTPLEVLLAALEASEHQRHCCAV